MDLTTTFVPIPVSEQIISEIVPDEFDATDNPAWQKNSAAQLISDLLEDDNLIHQRPIMRHFAEIEPYVNVLARRGYDNGAIVVEVKETISTFNAYDIGVILYLQRWIDRDMSEYKPIKVAWHGRSTDRRHSHHWPDELLILAPGITPERRAEVTRLSKVLNDKRLEAIRKHTNG